MLVANRLADVAIGLQRGQRPGAGGGDRADLPVPPRRGHRRAARPARQPRASGAGWSTRRAPTRAATPGSCWPGWGSRTTGSACSPTRPPPGRRPPTARAWPRRSSTWSPSSCAAASCRWSSCPASPMDACWHVTHAGAPAPQHRGQRAPALPGHPGGHAADALPGGRRAAVPVPPARLRHDLELATPGSCGDPWQGHLSKSLFGCCRAP